MAEGVLEGEADLVEKCVSLKEAPVCYPGECSISEELERAGVECVYNEGERDLFGFKVLGVGFRGVVLAGRWKGNKVAIKVARTDCPRCDMVEEARMTKLAYPHAPKVYAYGPKFIIMELITYPPIEDVLKHEDIDKIRETIVEVLRAGRELDKRGIDHGELVRPWKHVRVGERIVFLDFGSASTKRKPSNVTSLVSGLLLKPAPPASTLAEKLGINKARLLEALRRYKRYMTDEAFEEVIKEIMR